MFDSLTCQINFKLRPQLNREAIFLADNSPSRLALVILDAIAAGKVDVENSSVENCCQEYCNKINGEKKFWKYFAIASLKSGSS